MARGICEAVLLVTIESQEDAVKFCYPPSQCGSKMTKQAPAFCFPEQQSFRTSIFLFNFRETFSFNLTQSDGSKLFGYCRRYLVEGIATCICVLTYLPSYGLFSGLLNVLESLAHQPDSFNVLSSFLYLLDQQKPPPAGQELTIRFTFPPPRSDSQNFKLYRPSGCNMLEDFVHFTDLFDSLGVKLVVTLWECLLRECRVLLCSRFLGKLTSSINAAIAILNPLSWQHILIPVLPNSLLDYCTAPMPFLIGVLPSSLPQILKMPLEEVYIFNLDEKTISSSPPEHFLPKTMRTNLISSLERVLVRSQSSSENQQNTKDINIARCFLVCLAKILEGYETFFHGKKFDREEFLQSSSTTKRCKEMLAESQIWECFLETQKELGEARRRSCILLRVIEWSENELPCFKCGDIVEHGNVFIHKGFPICTSCKKRKKKQITKDNVKQKLKLRKKDRGGELNIQTMRARPSSTNRRRSSAELPETPISLLNLKERVKMVTEKKKSKQFQFGTYCEKVPTRTSRNVPPETPTRAVKPLPPSVPDRPRLPTKIQESIMQRSALRSTSEPNNNVSVLNRSIPVPARHPVAIATNNQIVSRPPVPLRPNPAASRSNRKRAQTVEAPMKLAISKSVPAGLTQGVNKTPASVGRPGTPTGPGTRVVKCPGCNLQIKFGPETITVQCLRRSWHPKCLKCAKCKLPFDLFFENFVPRNGRPFHSSCVPPGNATP